jgi:heavy metal sensor kinase
MIDSLRVKLTLWYTGVLALILLSFSGGVYALMARKLHNRLDAGLQTAMEGTVRLFIHEKVEGETDLYSAQSTLRKYYYPREAIAFFDQSGQLFKEQPQGQLHASLPTEIAALDKDGPQFFTRPEAETGAEGGLRLVVQRLQHQTYPKVFIVIAQARSELANDLELLSSILYLAVPLALLLTAIGGWWLARKSLTPVVAMSETARRISAANLDQQLPVANPRDELGRLATTFNDLLARLNAAFAQQRQFMADASHELRTPLSVIHTTAQVTLEKAQRAEGEYREALTLMDEQTRRLARIVEEMFTLARADAGQRPIAPRDFYLDELVAETARAAAVLAARKNIRLETAPAPETPFRGDEDLLRQLLLNLLDNAIKFTPAGGAVWLRLERQNGAHQLTVADTGAGIPAAAQAQIFERFYRVDKARSRADQANGSGAGLGLSIARWIAEAHGGALRLAQSDHTGSTFVVTLPAAQKGGNRYDET